MSLEHNHEVVWEDIEKVIPNPRNTNIHTKEQIERLAKILNYQGFRSPIQVSNLSGMVVVGHARLEAAKVLGLKKVPVSYQDFTDEQQEFAHMNADNEIAKWAEIDFEMVKSFDFADGFDTDLMGFKNFDFNTNVETKNNNKEIDVDDLTKDLNVTCPKCGFEFEAEGEAEYSEDDYLEE